VYALVWTDQTVLSRWCVPCVAFIASHAKFASAGEFLGCVPQELEQTLDYGIRDGSTVYCTE
jgi:hypothetical protein